MIVNIINISLKISSIFNVSLKIYIEKSSIIKRIKVNLYILNKDIVMLSRGLSIAAKDSRVK